MFLAGKVEETPRPLKDVILVSYEIIHKKDPAAVQKIKQKVPFLLFNAFTSIFVYFLSHSDACLFSSIPKKRLWLGAQVQEAT